MKKEIVEALERNMDESFHDDQIPKELKENEFVERNKRDEFPCPDPQCSKMARVVSEKKGLVTCNRSHRFDYEKQDVFWEVNTELAVREMLDESEINYELEDEHYYYRCISGDTTFLIIPGEVKKKKKLGLIDKAVKEDKIGVVCFEKTLEREMQEISQLMGNLTMIISPPNVQRKMETFKEFNELNKELEARIGIEEEDIPSDLVEMVKRDVSNAVEELIQFEKIQNSRAQRDRLEKLSVVCLANLYDLPLKTLGMESTGKRVPDGVGLIRNENNEHSGLLVVDAKSVSSDTRDYPKIDEKNSPQYKVYLERAKNVTEHEDISRKYLLFISPEYNKSKARDFCEELREQGFKDYKVIFLTLGGLALLLENKNSFSTDRAVSSVSTTSSGWKKLLNDLLEDPQINREEADYKLDRQNGIHLGAEEVEAHISSFIENELSVNTTTDRLHRLMDES